MADILIYTKNFCPYCTAAKELLKSKNVTFTEKDIGKDQVALEEMLSKSQGRTTVPEIFINGKLIGGFDNLSALDQEGKLDELLKK